MELGDVTKIDDKMIASLAQVFGPLVDLVIVAGGSPCQDLSSLNSSGCGLAGSRSKLFFETPRVVGIIREHFAQPVHSLVENVISMSFEDRSTFSEVLNTTPYLDDARWFPFMQRPRLFWYSWEVACSSEFRVFDDDGFKEVEVDCELPHREHWIDDGFTWSDEASRMYTFTTLKPRATPPADPAGLATASEGAVERWQKHEHMGQVYQYEEEFLLESIATGSFRLPTISEREALFGFDKGYLEAAVAEKTTFKNRFATCASLVGNSLSVHVIGFLLRELLQNRFSLRIPLQSFMYTEVSPPAWNIHKPFAKRTQPVSSEEVALVYG